MSDWLQIEIDHASYYRWVPVPQADADPSTTVESSFPGYRMTRATIAEPTTSTTAVHLPDLARWNDEREAAGLGRRPDVLNLIGHLADGAWPKQFPLDSITAIRADDPGWQAQLFSAFVTAPKVLAAPAPDAVPDAVPDPEATP